jgi:hypothetical protein
MLSGLPSFYLFLAAAEPKAEVISENGGISD